MIARMPVRRRVSLADIMRFSLGMHVQARIGRAVFDASFNTAVSQWKKEHDHQRLD